MEKLSTNELKAQIRKIPKDEAVQIALDVLGKQAKEWYQYRFTGTPKRLVDPETGQVVREFSANGQKYFVRLPEDGINLYRYTKIKEFLSIVGFDATYVDQMNALNKIKGLVDSLVTKQPKLTELGAAVVDMQQSILKTRDRNWDWSLIAATLFIVKPDEDLTTWIQSDQEKKVEDWNAAGLLQEDFFILTVGWGSRLAQRSKKLFDKAELMAKMQTSLAG